MASKYIKIFNDTVLKQSILQGYEDQRTQDKLGKFTSGELAFTRDTGRLFVGNFSDDKKTKDLDYVKGGLLCGNKYMGLSKSSTYSANTWNHNSKYNPTYKTYNGDYTYDPYTASIILFDNQIKNYDTINKEKFQITKNHSSDEWHSLYNNGYMKLRYFEPDCVSIKVQNKNFHNIFSVDDEWHKNATYGLFDSKSFKMTNGAISLDSINFYNKNASQCNLPFNFYVVGSKNEKIQYNFKPEVITESSSNDTQLPDYISGFNSNNINQLNDNLSNYDLDLNSKLLSKEAFIQSLFDNSNFRNKLEGEIASNSSNILIQSGLGITVTKNSDIYTISLTPEEDNTSNPSIYIDNTTGCINPWNTPITETQKPKYSGSGIYSHSGQLNALHTYGDINYNFDDIESIINKSGKSEVIDTDDQILKNNKFNTSDFSIIKTNHDSLALSGRGIYVNKYFNTGINYIEDGSKITFSSSQVQSWLSDYSLTIDLNYLKKTFEIVERKDGNGNPIYEIDGYDMTTVINSLIGHKASYIPSHAQSIIVQVTNTSSGATIKYPNAQGIVLYESPNTSGISTVEIPLIPKLKFYKTDDNDNEFVYGNYLDKQISFYYNKCTVKYIGYRV